MRIRALVQEARWRQPGSGGEGAGAENKEERRGKLVGGCAEQREARVRWRFILRSQPPLATAPPSHACQLGVLRILRPEWCPRQPRNSQTPDIIEFSISASKQLQRKENSHMDRSVVGTLRSPCSHRQTHLPSAEIKNSAFLSKL